MWNEANRQIWEAGNRMFGIFTCKMTKYDLLTNKMIADKYFIDQQIS